MERIITDYSVLQSALPRFNAMTLTSDPDLSLEYILLVLLDLSKVDRLNRQSPIAWAIDILQNLVYHINHF